MEVAQKGKSMNELGRGGGKGGRGNKGGRVGMPGSRLFARSHLISRSANHANVTRY